MAVLVVAGVLAAAAAVPGASGATAEVGEPVAEASLAVAARVDGPTVLAQAPFTLHLDLENTGTVPLTGVTVTWPALFACPTTTADLPVGATRTLDCTRSTGGDEVPSIVLLAGADAAEVDPVAAAPLEVGVLQEPPPVEVDTFGGPGTGDGQLTFPGASLDTDRTGDLYVADATGRVQRFSAAGELEVVWDAGGAGPVAAAPDGSAVYVGHGAVIDRFTPEGVADGSIPTPGAAAGQRVTDVAADGHGGLRVATSRPVSCTPTGPSAEQCDVGHDGRVWELDAEGAVLAEVVVGADVEAALAVAVSPLRARTVVGLGYRPEVDCASAEVTCTPAADPQPSGGVLTVFAGEAGPRYPTTGTRWGDVLAVDDVAPGPFGTWVLADERVQRVGGFPYTGVPVPDAVAVASGPDDSVYLADAAADRIVVLRPTTTWPPEPSFVDVQPGHAFYADVAWMALTNISRGYADGGYHPAEPVTRQAMAAFLYSLVPVDDFNPVGAPRFSDVPHDHPFATVIQWLAAEGIAQGYPDGRFHPEARVTRQAMAAFLYRYAGSPDVDPPGEPSFADVPADHAFFAEVEWLAAQRTTTGYADGRFRPEAPVTRQAMAAFLHRFLLGPLSVG